MTCYRESLQAQLVLRPEDDVEVPVVEDMDCWIWMEVVDNVERCGKCLSPKCFRRKAASQCGAQHVCRILHVLMKDWQDDPEKALSPQLYLLAKELQFHTAFHVSCFVYECLARLIDKLGELK